MLVVVEVEEVEEVVDVDDEVDVEDDVDEVDEVDEVDVDVAVELPFSWPSGYGRIAAPPVSSAAVHGPTVQSYRPAQCEKHGFKCSVCWSSQTGLVVFMHDVVQSAAAASRSGVPSPHQALL